MADLCFLVHSEAGDGHINEDRVSVRPHLDAAAVLLCCLADGQGGQAGGASAAQITVETGLQAAAALLPSALFHADPWYSVAAAADDAACEDDAAGFCTLVSLAVSPREVCGVSCGDSGALLISGGQEVLLTENQRKNPPVGSSAAYPVAFSAKFNPGWKLLVVSDGVWKYVGWEKVARIAVQHHGVSLIAALRQAALDAGGGKMQDDFTVALLYDEG